MAVAKRYRRHSLQQSESSIEFENSQKYIWWQFKLGIKMLADKSVIFLKNVDRSTSRSLSHCGTFSSNKYEIFVPDDELADEDMLLGLQMLNALDIDVKNMLEKIAMINTVPTSLKFNLSEASLRKVAHPMTARLICPRIGNQTINKTKIDLQWAILNSLRSSFLSWQLALGPYCHQKA